MRVGGGASPCSLSTGIKGKRGVGGSPASRSKDFPADRCANWKRRSRCRENRFNPLVPGPVRARGTRLGALRAGGSVERHGCRWREGPKVLAAFPPPLRCRARLLPDSPPPRAAAAPRTHLRRPAPRNSPPSGFLPRLPPGWTDQTLPISPRQKKKKQKTPNPQPQLRNAPRDQPRLFLLRAAAGRLQPRSLARPRPAVRPRPPARGLRRAGDKEAAAPPRPPGPSPRGQLRAPPPAAQPARCRRLASPVLRGPGPRAHRRSLQLPEEQWQEEVPASTAPALCDSRACAGCGRTD